VAISASYAYNQSGIRTRAVSRTTVNGTNPYDTTRTFLVDEANHTGYAQVFEEFDAVNSTPARSYVIGNDILADSGRYLLYDGHGSTRMLTNAAGHVTDRYSFDAYGIALGGNPNTVAPSATDMLYSGEQFVPVCK